MEEQSTGKNYLSRSWALLTSEKGWYKPVLVLAAVYSIPVAGSILGTLGLIGYSLEWARLTAWGIDAVPKQRAVSIGGCLGSGWRGFWVRTCWSLLFALAMAVVAILLSLIALGPLTSLLSVFSVLVGAVGLIASLRAAIYEKFGAGFGFSQLWDMFKRDKAGFFLVLGIQLLGAVAAGLVGAIASSIVLAVVTPTLPSIVTFLSGSGSSNVDLVQLADGILQSFVGTFPLLAVVGFAMRLLSVVFELLSCTAAGLWLRQFNVPGWGSPSDPVPAQFE